MIGPTDLLHPSPEPYFKRKIMNKNIQFLNEIILAIWGSDSGGSEDSVFFLVRDAV